MAISATEEFDDFAASVFNIIYHFICISRILPHSGMVNVVPEVIKLLPYVNNIFKQFIIRWLQLQIFVSAVKNGLGCFPFFMAYRVPRHHKRHPGNEQFSGESNGLLVLPCL